MVKTTQYRLEKSESKTNYAHELTQELTEKYAPEKTPAEKYRVSVVSSGLGAKHTNWGMLNFQLVYYDQENGQVISKPVEEVLVRFSWIRISKLLSVYPRKNLREM